MKNKPPIKYVDMCIYVDNNIGKPGADATKVYDYLTMICYMLSVKKNLFNDERYYDLYSHYLASSVYLRMTSKELEPIKSCLNYIKSIIMKRKVDFEKSEFSYISNDSVSYDTFKSSSEIKLRDSLTGYASIDVCDYFNNISKIIYDVISKGIYKNDKVLVWKLYQSCVLSLLRNITLSNESKLKLHMYSMEGMSDGNLRDILNKETLSAPIAYNLGDEWLDYIAVLLQYIKDRIIKDIDDISKIYNLPDKMVEDILMTSLMGDEELEKLQ
jgi:hypothetical protein